MNRQSFPSSSWATYCARCGQPEVLDQDYLCDQCRRSVQQATRPAQYHSRPGSGRPSRRQYQREFAGSRIQEQQEPFTRRESTSYSQRQFEDNRGYGHSRANRGGRYRQQRGHYNPHVQPRTDQRYQRPYHQEPHMPPEGLFTETRPAPGQTYTHRPRRRNRNPQPISPFDVFADSPEEFMGDMFEPFMFFGPPDDFLMVDDEEDFYDFPSFPPMMLGMMNHHQSSAMRFIIDYMGLGSAFFQPELSLEGFFSQLQAQHPDRIRPASSSAVRRIEKKPVDRAMTEEVCTVCQDKFKRGQQASVLRCEHSFHTDCLDPWLRTNDTCPVCRQTVD